MKNPESVEAAGVLIGFNRSGEREKLNIANGPFSGNSRTLKQDARILQLLKKECQKNGTGEKALQKVFTGLLSVHNRRLLDFAEALNKANK